jgi:hypothetical protein
VASRGIRDSNSAVRKERFNPPPLFFGPFCSQPSSAVRRLPSDFCATCASSRPTLRPPFSPFQFFVLSLRPSVRPSPVKKTYLIGGTGGRPRSIRGRNPLGYSFGSSHEASSPSSFSLQRVQGRKRAPFRLCVRAPWPLSHHPTPTFSPPFLRFLRLFAANPPPPSLNFNLRRKRTRPASPERGEIDIAGCRSSLVHHADRDRTNHLRALKKDKRLMARAAKATGSRKLADNMMTALPVE